MYVSSDKCRKKSPINGDLPIRTDTYYTIFATIKNEGAHYDKVSNTKCLRSLKTALNEWNSTRLVLIVEIKKAYFHAKRIA